MISVMHIPNVLVTNIVLHLDNVIDVKIQKLQVIPFLKILVKLFHHTTTVKSTQTVMLKNIVQLGIGVKDVKILKESDMLNQVINAQLNQNQNQMIYTTVPLTSTVTLKNIVQYLVGVNSVEISILSIMLCQIIHVVDNHNQYLNQQYLQTQLKKANGILNSKETLISLKTILWMKFSI